MKKNFVFIILFTSVFVINNCKTTVKSTESVVYKDSLLFASPDHMIISFIKGRFFNHPTFVLWEEDMNGDYLKTIFITKSYASGIFGYQMIGDSIWVNEPGSSLQPAALPYWTFKKGLIDNKTLIPTPQHPFVDSFTGATPTQNFQFETAINSEKTQYRILLELNQSWDWNRYWTNNKYPDSPAYKHSAQPSIIYSVVITQGGENFCLNPIGHGDPKGESGKLFTDISTLTTAREIFELVKIEIKK